MRTLILVIVLFLAACRGADQPVEDLGPEYISACEARCVRNYEVCATVPVDCAESCEEQWAENLAAASAACIAAETDYATCEAALDCTANEAIRCAAEMNAWMACD